MKRALLTFVGLLVASPLAAQWLDHPTPGIPRLADGKPNLSAPAPKAADGKPDLSGLWRINGFGYAFNIFGDHDPGMLPAAEAIFKRKFATFAKEDTDVL